jgi:hypothetical protein
MKVTVADRAPDTVGVKTTSTTQEAPGASEAPHPLLLMEKSPALMVTLVMDSGAPPPFVSVIS